MAWRMNRRRELARQRKRGGGAGSTPAVRMVAPAGIAQLAQPTLKRLGLGGRLHSPRFLKPKTIRFELKDYPYEPLTSVFLVTP